MAKKNLGFQFSVLSMVIIFFSWLAFTDAFTEIPHLNAILEAYKTYFLTIAGVLAVPPIINLILQMSSKDREKYDDKPYYAVLKGISHLVFSFLIILILAILFAYSWTYLQVLLSEVWLAFILAAIIVLSLHFYIWKWLENKFGLKCFGFFSYIHNT